MRSHDASAVDEALRGDDRIRERIGSLMASCTTSSWSFRLGDQTPSFTAVERSVEAETLSRGVAARALYPRSVRHDRNALGHATWLARRGAAVRTYAGLPMQVLIIDERIAAIPVVPGHVRAGVIVTSDSNVLTDLCELFEEHWRRSRPLQPRGHRRVGPLSEQERQAMHLWSPGFSHEAVARRLGVSVRTVYRYSDRVQEVLQAQSPFQAGVRAAALGLVVNPDDVSPWHELSTSDVGSSD